MLTHHLSAVAITLCRGMIDPDTPAHGCMSPSCWSTWPRHAAALVGATQAFARKVDREIGQRRLPPGIPPGWDRISLDALWALLNRPRRTPQTTIEAILICVRERGLKALEERANIERLSCCDESARAQINDRIARLVEQKRCPG
jgi:hypothetical protein